MLYDQRIKWVEDLPEGRGLKYSLHEFIHVLVDEIAHDSKGAQENQESKRDQGLAGKTHALWFFVRLIILEIALIFDRLNEGGGRRRISLERLPLLLRQIHFWRRWLGN